MNLTEKLDGILRWFCVKIGTFDKLQWEKSVDETYEGGFKAVPRGSAKLKTNLIDVDLVRGSTFTKAKANQSLVASFRQATFRVVFYPLFYRWWEPHTTRWAAWLFMLAYWLQVSILSQFFVNGTYFVETECITLVEVCSPILMMLMMGTVHCHIVASQLAVRHRKSGLKSQRSSPKDESEFFPRCSYLSASDEDAVTENSQEDWTQLNDPIDCVAGELLLSTNDKQHVEPLSGDWSGEEATANQNQQNESREKLSRDVPETVAAAAATTSTPPPTPLRGPPDIRLLQQQSLNSAQDMTELEWDATSITSDLSSNSSSVEDSSPEDKIDSDEHDILAVPSLPPRIFKKKKFSSQSEDRISCVLYEDEWKKVEMSVFEISSMINAKVRTVQLGFDYLLVALTFAVLVAALPIVYRAHLNHDLPELVVAQNESIWPNGWQLNYLCRTRSGCYIIGVATVQRFSMSMMLFTFMAVVERLFRQRFLQAKYFCHLTSARRAKKHHLPHFRLHKVVNIKLWLSVRSYLKRCGPQRSVDLIVSFAFIVTVVLFALICLQFLKDSESFFDSIYNAEVLAWALFLGIFLLRYMTIGHGINRKYRNLSTVITEQINLYLQIEEKPHKKEELHLANNVLKLAAHLLKELESPFKISGLSINPFIYNVTKVVILSAFSAVLTEILGFKLKLYKIKFK